MLTSALLVLSVVVQSKSVSQSALLEQATADFSAGNYDKALSGFRSIQSANMGSENSESLRYNIAVCHYKLQQWTPAKKLFTQLHHEQAGESQFTYSLAVIEKNLGNAQRAADLFLEVSALSTDSTLSDAARKQYHLLSQPGANANQTPRNSTLINISLELNAGNDNNVLEPGELSSTGRSDQFSEAIAMASWQSDDAANNRWVVDGFGYTSRYDSVDEYNFDMLDIGVRKYSPTEFGRWYWGIRSNASALGNNGYLHTNSLQLGNQGWLADRYKWKLDYQYKHRRSLNPQFDPFAGNTHRLNLNLAGTVSDNWQWKLGYRYDVDDRDDLDLGDLFTSYSAQRHGIEADWGYRQGKWLSKFSANYRWSDYMDDNTALDGSKTLRKDQRLKLSARSSWKLIDDWSLSAEYSFTNNESTIETYDYDRHMLIFGIRWDW